MYGSGITLDEYIKRLEEIRKKHGGHRQCWLTAYDYPEGAEGPHIEQKGDGYTPTGVVVLA